MRSNFTFEMYGGCQCFELLNTKLCTGYVFNDMLQHQGKVSAYSKLRGSMHNGAEKCCRLKVSSKQVFLNKLLPDSSYGSR